MDSSKRLNRRAIFYKIEGKDGVMRRCAMGEDRYNATISNATVEEIRQAYENDEGGYRKLGRRFGLNPLTIRDIVTYRRRIRG